MLETRFVQSKTQINYPLEIEFECAGRWQQPGKAFVDLQHDVTSKDVQLAHLEGYKSVEHLKRYTTQGMAADQGKTSNVNALALMANLRDQPIQSVGTTTFRPPFTEVSIGALAGHEHGPHFEPQRFSPIHGWHQRKQAEFTATGLWIRAWYYP